MNSPAASGAPTGVVARIQRVRHELRRRELVVLRTEQPSPQLRRIVFGGAALDGFTSLSFDDHVKLILPQPGGAEPVMRDYTPCHFDATAGELTIEFVLHGEGPAGRWAAAARPGDTATIGGPRGSFVLPHELDWLLLVGDAAALPAIRRRLAEAPAGARVELIALQPDPAERRPMPSAAALQLHWVADEAACLAALRAWRAGPGSGFAWAAGEARLMAAVRRVLVDEQGLDGHAVRAAAYWKRGQPAHHETLGG